jgi:hypothetical protein
MTEASVVDPHYFDVDPDADSTYHMTRIRILLFN